MANTWFQFKRFTIHHDKCAMKVTTDACLFGAWVASKMSFQNDSLTILDIGAGTGLLSLMLAQQLASTQITGVELDEAAAEQAAENVSLSPFSGHIKIVQTDILQFQPSRQFDLVISNPPFHEKQLASPRHHKNKAHHDASLTLDELLDSCARLASPAGRLALLMPYYRKQEVVQKATFAGFNTTHICDVRQSPQHDFFRSMFLFSRSEVDHMNQDELVIATAPQQYSPEFVTLLKDYYLYL